MLSFNREFVYIFVGNSTFPSLVVEGIVFLNVVSYVCFFLFV